MCVKILGVLFKIVWDDPLQKFMLFCERLLSWSHGKIQIVSKRLFLGRTSAKVQVCFGENIKGKLFKIWVAQMI